MSRQSTEPLAPGGKFPTDDVEAGQPIISSRPPPHGVSDSTNACHAEQRVDMRAKKEIMGLHVGSLQEDDQAAGGAEPPEIRHNVDDSSTEGGTLAHYLPTPTSTTNLPTPPSDELPPTLTPAQPATPPPTIQHPVAAPAVPASSFLAPPPRRAGPASASRPYSPPHSPTPQSTWDAFKARWHRQWMRQNGSGGKGGRGAAAASDPYGFGSAGGSREESLSRESSASGACLAGGGEGGMGMSKVGEYVKALRRRESGGRGGTQGGAGG